MTDDSTTIWTKENSPFALESDANRSTKSGGADPPTEEKVERLAEVVLQLTQTVEQLADAQDAVTQLADGDEKGVWADQSPFATGGRDR
jgi:hypothetical protein